MKESQIENVVKDIMSNEGPDGHVDGSRVIAEFIKALINGNGKEWADEYVKDKKYCYYENK